MSSGLNYFEVFSRILVIFLCFFPLLCLVQKFLLIGANTSHMQEVMNSDRDFHVSFIWLFTL